MAEYKSKNLRIWEQMKYINITKKYEQTKVCYVKLVIERTSESSAICEEKRYNSIKLQ